MSVVESKPAIEALCASPDGLPVGTGSLLPRTLVADPAMRMLAAALEKLDASAEEGGILAFIEANLDLLDGEASPVWPALGSAWGEHGWGNVPLGMAFYVASLGGVGRWTCTLPVGGGAIGYLGPCPVVLEGRVSFRTDGRRIDVSTRDGTRTFLRMDGTWTKSDATEEAVRIGGAAIIPFAMTGGFEDVSFVGGLSLASSPMGEIRRSLSLALRAIGSAYSRGLAWMTPVLRGIVLVDTGDGTTTSGSSSSHPGLVYVSHPIDVHHLAAQLIHECAHQYLALLNGHERLVRVDCRETFYSPFKRAHRPLYNVLLAFHAAVNIKRLTSAMLRVGLRSGYLEQEDARLDGEIDQMHRDIASSEGWTPAGRRLLGELERAMA